jgi:hypothetical protein
MNSVTETERNTTPRTEPIVKAEEQFNLRTKFNIATTTIHTDSAITDDL